MSYWGKRLSGQYKSNPVTIEGGINRSTNMQSIPDSEAWVSENTSSAKWPAFSVMPGRQHAFADTTKPNAVGVFNNQYPHVLDGTTWKRWDGSAWQNVATGLTDTKGKFVEFVREDGRYMVLFPHKKYWDGTSVSDITDVNCPATNLVTVDDYRIYALKDNIVYCSALGSITDWTTADDANKISLTNSKGPSAGVFAYKDTVYAFSERSNTPVQGNDPYDQDASLIFEDGCVSNKCIIEHKGSMYFLDYGAFKMSSGGPGTEVSQNIKPWLDGINLTYKNKCCSGKSGKYIYLSIPYASTENNVTLEYDTERKTWHTWLFDAVDFINIGNDIYAMDSSGQPWKLNSGTDINGTAISWKRETGVKTVGLNKKTISELRLLVNLPVGSTLSISASTTINTDTWESIYTFTASAELQTALIYIPTTKLQDISQYRLKFAGTGPCEIHYYLHAGRERR